MPCQYINNLTQISDHEEKHFPSSFIPTHDCPQLSEAKRNHERVQHHSATQSPLSPRKAVLSLNKQVRLVTPSDAPEVKKVADGFAEQLKQTAGISLTEAESADGKPAIAFVVQEDMPKEALQAFGHPLPSLRSPLHSQMAFSMVCRLFIGFFLLPSTERN